jgi:hypothetical protein
MNAHEIRNTILKLEGALDYAMLTVVTGIDKVRRIEAEIERLEALLKPVNAGN